MSKLIIPAGARPDATFPGGWTLYRLPQNNSFLWEGFKLMQPPGTPAQWGRRRSYRLAWNVLEERFGKDGHLTALARDAELYAMVELHMSLNYNRAWLASPDGGGYTAEEIQAELSRLAAQRRQRRAARRAAAAL